MVTWLLIIIYLAFISLGLPDSMLGAAWPVVWPELDSSVSSAGLISMTIAGGTIFSSLMSGYAIERLGVGRLTLISCMLTAAALFGFSMAPSFIWFFIFAIPLGIGGGAVDSALNHYVAENYKAHHMNWLHCFWGVGATTGPLIMAAYIADQSSWRDGYAAVAAVQCVLVVILFVTLPLWKRVAASKARAISLEEKDILSHNAPANEKLSKLSLLKLRGVRPTLLAFLFYSGAESIVGLWGASYLVGAKNIGADQAATWIALYFGGITLGRFITGFITFKVHNKWLIRYGQLIAICGGMMVLLSLPTAVSFVGLILIGLGLAPIFPGLLHETPARFGKENAPKLMGIQMAFAYTGATFLPPLFGVVAAQSAIGLFPIALLLFLVIMLLSAERINHTLSKKPAEQH